LGNFIQDLLRDRPPVMILDMGLGSREESLAIPALPKILTASPATHTSPAVALLPEEQ
jgi:hypothetical protein